MPSKTTIIHLVRHGEVFNPQDVIYERLEGFSLSERGLKMAENIAQFITKSSDFENSDFKDVKAIYSSPLKRTQQTIKPFAKLINLPVVLDERLIESSHSLAGKNIKSELKRMLKKFELIKIWKLIKNPTLPSWGEPYVDISERMMSFVKEMKNKHKGETIIVCSHQNPIWTVRQTCEERKLWHNPKRRVCELGSITSLYFDDLSESFLKTVYHPVSRAI